MTKNKSIIAVLNENRLWDGIYKWTAREIQPEGDKLIRQNEKINNVDCLNSQSKSPEVVLENRVKIVKTEMERIIFNCEEREKRCTSALCMAAR